MGTSGKVRQKKWKEKQASKGKKMVSVMLSERAKELIDRESKKTGETIASVIERAVENLFDIESEKQWCELPPAWLSNTQKEIIRKVNRRHYGLHLNPSDIARLYNERSVPTLTGVSQWDEAEVQRILDYIAEHDLRVKLQFQKKWE